MLRLFNILPGTVFLFLCSSLLLAAEPDKQGRYDIEECFIGTHDMIFSSDNAMGGAYKVHSIAPSAKPGNLWHNVTGYCLGSWKLINGQYSESSYCEYTDSSGDKFFGTGTRKNDEQGYWQAVGGTGKYVGMTNTSRWKPITDSPQPDGLTINCLRDRGSWKLQ